MANLDINSSGLGLRTARRARILGNIPHTLSSYVAVTNGVPY